MTEQKVETFEIDNYLFNYVKNKKINFIIADKETNKTSGKLNLINLLTQEKYKVDFDKRVENNYEIGINIGLLIEKNNYENNENLKPITFLHNYIKQNYKYNQILYWYDIYEN